MTIVVGMSVLSRRTEEGGNSTVAGALKRSDKCIATQHTGEHVESVTGELVIEQRERDRRTELLADHAVDSAGGRRVPATQRGWRIVARRRGFDVERHVSRRRGRAARR